ncbi:hypothetical protein J31TS4_08850 [Paenibacillus sp. J31TS4]|uniref:DUF2273 domain-containing protein n=1 Tax=Paenibacillus sp. J31TS4 TaxID=2807195 RepID=UPI001B241B20|nr:DUF2273 domain-containing protein [Paenibacillus sp. J31TS4]GIP37605.1 hypothetical protein J31TS4_08850 [Paenibacillus sp. J31TS4]
MWRQLWERHPGKTVGTAMGLGLGVIYLFFGFWDMLIFAFIAFIGYYVGKKIDLQDPGLNVEQIWRWLTERWRMFR